jgi:hypothetical protein
MGGVADGIGPGDRPDPWTAAHDLHNSCRQVLGDEPIDRFLERRPPTPNANGRLQASR